MFSKQNFLYTEYYFTLIDFFFIFQYRSITKDIYHKIGKGKFKQKYTTFFLKRHLAYTCLESDVYFYHMDDF